MGIVTGIIVEMFAEVFVTVDSVLALLLPPERLVVWEDSSGVGVGVTGFVTARGSVKK